MKIQFRFPKEAEHLYQLLATRAEDEKISTNEWCRNRIIKLLDNQPEAAESKSRELPHAQPASDGPGTKEGESSDTFPQDDAKFSLQIMLRGLSEISMQIADLSRQQQRLEQRIKTSVGALLAEGKRVIPEDAKAWAEEIFGD